MSEVIGVRRYKKSEMALTVGGTLFVLAVGAVTGLQSWGHIVHVGRSVGEPFAPVLPVSIDGMMLAGTMLGAVDRLRGMKTRGWAVAGLWGGAALTLAFNTLSAVDRGIGAMIIAVLCAVAFLISVEMVFHPSRTPLAAIKRIKNVQLDEVKSPEPAPAAKKDEDMRDKQKTFSPGRPQHQRPDRSKQSWQQRPAKSGNGNGGPVTQKPRPDVKPATVSVTTPSKDTPMAMGESLKDLVATDDGKNSAPIEMVIPSGRE